MRSKLFILSFFVILSSISCTTKTKSNKIAQKPEFPIKIDLIEAMSNTKGIKLSEIADSITYIPLNNIEEKPIGVIQDFKYFPNNIFIEVGGGSLYRFDGKGNFLNQISSVGRGPAEYTSGSKISVIDNPEKVYILCNFTPRNLLEFDYNGNFIAKVLTANPLDGGFEAISSDRFIFLASSRISLDSSIHYLACLKDRSNKSLFMNDHPFFSNHGFKNLERFLYGGARSGVYYDGAPLFYDEYSMDTIYSIRNDSIYSRYIIDKGNEGAPFEKLYSYSLTPERYNYLSPVYFVETPNDVFVMAIFKNKDFYLINYTKKKQFVSSIKTPYVVPDMEHIRQGATVYPRYENDIDGGISLVPGKPNRQGDIWTYKFDAIDFKNKLTKEYLLNSKALYPEKKKALIRLVDSLNEFDNPIIMVVYLKKQSK